VGGPEVLLSVAIDAKGRDIRLPVQAVLDQLKPEEELIILDGGGNIFPNWDQIPENIRIIDVRHLLDGPYFPEARLKNLAVHLSRRDYIVLLNADIVLGPKGLSQIRQQLSADPKALLTAATVFLDCSTTQKWLEEGQPTFHDLPPLQATGDAYGSLMAARKDLIEEAGGFCEDFVGWGAWDDDFVERWTGPHYQANNVFHLWHWEKAFPKAAQPNAIENFRLLHERHWERFLKKEELNYACP